MTLDSIRNSCDVLLEVTLFGCDARDCKTVADIGGEVFNASCFVEIDVQLVKVGFGVTSPLISCP